MSDPRRPKLIDLYRLRDEFVSRLVTLADDRYLTLPPSHGLWRQFHTNPRIGELMVSVETGNYRRLDPEFEQRLNHHLDYEDDELPHDDDFEPDSDLLGMLEDWEQTLEYEPEQEPGQAARQPLPIPRQRSDDPFELWSAIEDVPQLRTELIEATLSDTSAVQTTSEWDREQLEEIHAIERNIAERELDLLWEFLNVGGIEPDQPEAYQRLEDDIDLALASAFGDISKHELEGDLTQTLGLLGMNADLSDADPRTQLSTWSTPREPLLLDLSESARAQLFAIAEDHDVTYQIHGYAELVGQVFRDRLAALKPDPVLNRLEQRQQQLESPDSRISDDALDESAEALDAEREAYFREVPEARFKHELVTRILEQGEMSEPADPQERLEVMQRAAVDYEERERAVRNGELNPASLDRIAAAEILELRKSPVPDVPPDFPEDPGAPELQGRPGPDRPDDLPRGGAEPSPERDEPDVPRGDDRGETGRDQPEAGGPKTQSGLPLPVPPPSPVRPPPLERGSIGKAVIARQPPPSQPRPTAVMRARPAPAATPVRSASVPMPIRDEGQRNRHPVDDRRAAGEPASIAETSADGARDRSDASRDLDAAQPVTTPKIDTPGRGIGLTL